MAKTSTVIIGAGHAGLAMSRRLTERSIDHVVLERAEVANSWRTERRPDLRLLTPNWLTDLRAAATAATIPTGTCALRRSHRSSRTTRPPSARPCRRIPMCSPFEHQPLATACTRTRTSGRRPRSSL